MPLELFMSAVPRQAALTKTPDGNPLLRGLPVLRTGVWNGKTYTAGDLQAMADNFAELQTADQWDPPMRPYHGYGADGTPLHLDAREVLGWHKGLAFDAAAGVLTADVEIVDAATVADLESGKLRYVSAEVYRSGYTSPSSGKTYDTPAYLGAAFVDNPAVKGMPWQVVVNAQDYGRSAMRVEQLAGWNGLSADDIRERVRAKVSPATAGANDVGGPWVQELFEDYVILETDGKHFRVPFSFDPAGEMLVGEKVEVKQAWVDVLSAQLTGHKATPKGARIMPKTLPEMLKALFSKAGVAESDLAELDQLQAAPPTPPAEGVPPAPVDPAVMRQLEQLQTANREQVAALELLKAERSAEQARHRVDQFVTEGVLPPALRPQALALVECLSAVPEIETLALDAQGAAAGTRKVAALELLAEILQGVKPAIAKRPSGHLWQGSLDGAEPKPTADEVDAAADALLAAGK